MVNFYLASLYLSHNSNVWQLIIAVILFCMNIFLVEKKRLARKKRAGKQEKEVVETHDTLVNEQNSYLNF